MAALIERLKIRVTVAAGWRRKSTVAQAVRGFQATEADGVWHLQRGMARLSDPRQRAIVFSHCLEEESHAEEFGRVYHVYGDRVMSPATYERKDLYGPAEEPWKTFAFVHVGEKDATERFGLLRDALDGGALRDALVKIVGDEEGHVDLTENMLLKMGATPPQIRREVLFIRARRLWEMWLRTGKRVVDLLATLLLSAAYFLLGPLLYRAARQRLSDRYVDFDNNLVKRLSP